MNSTVRARNTGPAASQTAAPSASSAATAASIGLVCFSLIRGTQLELIGEVFNVLNTKNLFVITNNQSLYTLNYNATTDRFTSITPNASFGVPSPYNTAVDPRQFQVAAKIVF